MRNEESSAAFPERQKARDQEKDFEQEANSRIYIFASFP